MLDSICGSVSMFSLKGKVVSKTQHKGKVRCNMSKVNGKVEMAVVGAKVETVVESAVVKDGRGAKAGVPHITNKVLAMDAAGREKWLNEKCGTDEIRDEVRSRLAHIE